MTEAKLAGDAVDEWTPITFAVELVRRMRRHQGVSSVPSLRASVAIPRFLFARWQRTRALAPRDYVEAAVLLTPPDDQTIAEAIAREILFPKTDLAPRKTLGEPDPIGKPAKPGKPKIDPTAGILGDLDLLSVDLDALSDLSELEAMIEEPDDDVFALFERLYSSADRTERAVAELIRIYGGPAELVATGARSFAGALAFVRVHLLARAGSTTPDEIRFGCDAGLGDALARAVKHPWEVAAVLAGQSEHAQLTAHLDDLEVHATARELGQTLRFLKPYRIDEALRTRFRVRSFARARDLNDHAEIVLGLEEWVDPDRALLVRSATDSPRRAMEAARAMRNRFGVSVEVDVLDAWSAAHPRPSLDELIDVAVDTGRWRELLTDALDRHVLAIRAEARVFTHDHTAPVEHRLAPVLIAQVSQAQRLLKCATRGAGEAARELATETPCNVREKDHFLPLLDSFLELHVVPSDVDRVVAAGEALGVDRDLILDRIGDALEQLRQLVLGDATDPARYNALIDRIDYLPPDMLDELATESRTMEAIAALLAIDLGGTASKLPEELVTQSLGFRGIGGGQNFLKQWFSHRTRLNEPLRAKIKAVAKEVLIDLAFDWIGKGGGASDQGLVPQTETRPMRAGDELDHLDLEATLDFVVAQGKRIEEIHDGDLLVSQTSRGRAAFCVLIDISGSMSGGDLAMCAISVVMLLGKLRSEELSLAVFESDTHVMKRFADEADLDTVADRVLDLEATGGTRVDAALRFCQDEMTECGEATVRVLFLLSDFAFFEPVEELAAHGRHLVDLGVSFLGASHGYLHHSAHDAILGATGGRSIRVKKIEELPALLLEVLAHVGDDR
jgi:Mg-chelatase subunit ChlD